jgi:hypothetical protein
MYPPARAQVLMESKVRCRSIKRKFALAQSMPRRFRLDNC